MSDGTPREPNRISEIDRRQALSILSSLSAIGLAGCTGDGSDNGTGDDTDSEDDETHRDDDDTEEAEGPVSLSSTGDTPLYDTFELELVTEDVPSEKFLTYADVTFRKDGREFDVDGFYDGDRTWIARFMPDEQGTWTYEWSFRGTSGSGHFDCTPKSNPTAHGHVRTDPDNPRYLIHDDGTAHYFYGSTWIGDRHYGPESKGGETNVGRVSDQEFVDFLDTLERYDHNGALIKTQLHPLGQEDTHEKIKWDLEWVGRQDWVVQEMAKRGIYCYINLFDIWSRDEDYWFEYNTEDSTKHVIDAWNDGEETAKENYIRYLVARYAGYYNVYWELGNEVGHGRLLDNLDDTKEAFLRQSDKYLRWFSEHDPYDLPIGLSGGPHNRRMYEELDVDIGFPHGGWTDNLPRKSEPKPVINNEPVQDKLYEDKRIRSASNRWKYRAIFWRVFTLGGCGASEATKLNYAEPLGDAVTNVLQDHQRFRDVIEGLSVPINETERDDSLVRSGPGKTSARGQSDEGYVAYFMLEGGSTGSGSVELNLPSGDYDYKWYDPSSGETDASGTVRSSGGSETIEHPSFDEDAVLLITGR